MATTKKQPTKKRAASKSQREEKVKSLRILEIDEMIRSGSYPNANDLCKKFEVSRSTIMRDLDFLRDRYNAPLEYDAVRNGFYYTNSSFFIKSVMLTEGELFSVSVIERLLEQYKNTPLENSIKHIFEKIVQLLPQEVSVDTFFMGKDVSFISDPLPQIDEKVFEAVFECLRKKHALQFAYRSVSSTTHKVRTIYPYHVICQKGNWYVLGYSLEKSEVRTYSLARIKDAKKLRETFEVPKDFKAEKYFDSEFGVWHNDKKPETIELLFSEKVNTYILERQWHTTQKVKQNKDGSVTLVFKSNQMQEVLYWVLSFGSRVKVVAPQSLADAVRAEARKMLK